MLEPPTSFFRCLFLNRVSKYGVPQHIPNYRANEVKEIISQTISYMEQVATDERYNPVRDDCKNKETMCSEWALDDGCDANPLYMKEHCAPACKSCDFIIERKEICGLAPDSSLDAIKPGGMTKLFEDMIYAGNRMGFDPKVLSRPLKMYNDTSENKSDKTAASSCEKDLTNPCDMADGPWVITLENFLSDQEISSLLDWGEAMNYERSQAGGKSMMRQFVTHSPIVRTNQRLQMYSDIVSPSRTSAHSWCTDECYQDEIVVRIRERVEAITGIPSANYECMQLLKYQVGQFYKGKCCFAVFE